MQRLPKETLHEIAQRGDCPYILSWVNRTFRAIVNRHGFWLSWVRERFGCSPKEMEMKIKGTPCKLDCKLDRDTLKRLQRLTRSYSHVAVCFRLEQTFLKTFCSLTAMAAEDREARVTVFHILGSSESQRFIVSLFMDWADLCNRRQLRLLTPASRARFEEYGKELHVPDLCFYPDTGIAGVRTLKHSLRIKGAGPSSIFVVCPLTPVHSGSLMNTPGTHLIFHAAENGEKSCLMSPSEMKTTLKCFL
jgi:hypothetical protein